MPTGQGNKWEYRVVEESKFNPREEYTLTYEITTVKSPYEGFPDAYVVTITRPGYPTEELVLGPSDDECYVERAMWSYLMSDAMEIGGWSQTGLIVDFPLQYRGDSGVNVPAGSFNCRELFFDNGNEIKPESWSERYAEDVGLVKYENQYKEYQGSVPPELVDWRTVTYELRSYDIYE
jgi:hypothetical protein